MTADAAEVARLAEGELVADGDRVTLNECPPGLFAFGASFGFKTEYVTTLEKPRRYQCDAYVLESGEYFWGGVSTTLERGRLMVQPLALRARAAQHDHEVG